MKSLSLAAAALLLGANTAAAIQCPASGEKISGTWVVSGVANPPNITYSRIVLCSLRIKFSTVVAGSTCSDADVVGSVIQQHACAFELNFQSLYARYRLRVTMVPFSAPLTKPVQGAGIGSIESTPPGDSIPLTPFPAIMIRLP